MLSDLVSSLTDPAYLFPILISIAVFATLFTVLAPYFERGDLDARMKSAALERDEIRARERARLNAEQSRGGTKGAGLRSRDNASVRGIVEQLNLKDALADGATLAKLRAAGYRTTNRLRSGFWPASSAPISAFTRRTCLSPTRPKSARPLSSLPGRMRLI